MYPSIDKKASGRRIRDIMNKKGFSISDIQRHLDLACVQTVYHWLDGISIPSVEHLFALSILFRVPMDEMICRNWILLRVELKRNCYGRMHGYMCLRTAR